MKGGWNLPAGICVALLLVGASRCYLAIDYLASDRSGFFGTSAVVGDTSVIEDTAVDVTVWLALGATATALIAVVALALRGSLAVRLGTFVSGAMFCAIPVKTLVDLPQVVREEWRYVTVPLLIEITAFAMLALMGLAARRRPA